jgi:Nucleotide modification associated domain 3
LRVGIDYGTGGALAPIFPDGTFEYIPIPEMAPPLCALTYATLPGRRVRSLATVLPARLAALPPHVDPDFSTVTYGDAAPRKRQQLLRLDPGDLLVFYAGLSPRPPEDRSKLFAIGYITVRRVHNLSARDLDRPDLRRKFARTAHFLRYPRDQHLALVEGEPALSRFFTRAVPLGDGRDCLLRDLACLGYQGSLQRAVGHWIRTAAGLSALETWLQGGPASLIEPYTQFIPVTSLLPSGKQRDLVVDDCQAREGDWVIAAGESDRRRIGALARVNRVIRLRGHNRAFCSIYWYFAGGGPVMNSSTFRAMSGKTPISNTSWIRHCLSRLYSRYRVGFHQETKLPSELRSLLIKRE